MKIVLDRRKEILSVECELSSVHLVLSRLIDEHLPVEILIVRTVDTFKQYPPVTLATQHRLDIDRRFVDRQLIMGVLYICQQS